MTETSDYPPVSPYLRVDDGAAALDFYARAFGAEVTERYDFEGKVGHASLRINGGIVMMSDDFPAYFERTGVRSPAALGGTTSTVHLTVTDVDAAYGRAIEAGATALYPPSDEFYGRHGRIRDPFGHVWSFVGPTKGKPPPEA